MYSLPTTLAQILFSIALLANLAGCSKDYAQFWTYQPPEVIGDGLAVGTMAEVGVDTELVAEALGRVEEGKYKEVHSVLIYRHGKLVVEEYFPGHKYQWDARKHHGELVDWDRDMLHNIHSANKSLMSASIGIAIDKGFIDNVHQPILDYLPDHQYLRNTDKQYITIEHLLTMTSGLNWPEWSAPYSSTSNPIVGIWFQEKDPVSYIMEMPFSDTPGTKYNYSTGHMVLLGEIIRNASGLNIEEFYNEYLLRPLGESAGHWAEIFPNGVYGITFHTTPRTMLKFGVAYLNEGMWNGERIVSEDWVAKSAVPWGPTNTGIDVPSEPSGKMGYSYTCWTKDYDHDVGTVHMYTASGFGGQHIMVLPELDAVVVFTGGNYLSKRPPFPILEKYLLPAFKK